jgi:16S rRNA (guanine527-N7)-methyltransferase
VSEAEQLIRDARSLGVELDAAQAAAQCRLLDELAHWNRSFNLTAITERREMLTHHLLDSLSILPFLAGERVLDIGTGAGFPGLPLAIAAPQRRFVLLDSNGKKIRFVAHAVRTLGLRNVEAVHARAGGREMAVQGPFDTVVARACAPLPELLRLAEGYCGVGTRLLAMKGRRQAEERQGLPAHWHIEAEHDLHVPGLDGERHVVMLQRVG